jgi:hypothetical protein
MKTFMYGVLFGWLVATVGVNGIMSAVNKISDVAKVQVVELAK